MKKWLFLAVVLLFSASNTWAGAVNPVSGVGAQAKAMGGAGTAVATGASAFYYNPALLAGPDSMADIGLDYYHVGIKYTDPTGVVHNSNPGEYFIPLAGISGYIGGGGLKAGIGLVTPNAFGSDFKSELDMYSKLSLTNITPAVAYHLSHNLSVGASVSIGYGMVDLTMPYAPAGVSLGALDSEARGFGYGYQVGVLYKPANWLSLGSSYQSPTRVELDGTTTLRTALGNMEDDFSSVIYFPGRVHLGVGIKPTEKLLVAADATYMDYSRTDKTDMNYDNWADAALALNWQSHWVYSLGAEYSATRNLKLRAGMSYQEKVIPDETLNPVTPDTDGGLSASLGFGWTSGNTSLDLAYARAWGLERNIPLPNAGAGEYSADVNVITAGLTHRW